MDKHLTPKNIQIVHETGTTSKSMKHSASRNGHLLRKDEHIFSVTNPDFKPGRGKYLGKGYGDGYLKHTEVW